MFFFVKTYKASTLYKFTLFKGTVCAISSYPPCKEDPIEKGTLQALIYSKRWKTFLYKECALCFMMRMDKINTC